MIKILIMVATILPVIILCVYNRKKNRHIYKLLKKTLSEINNTYKEIFTEKNKVIKFTHGGIFIVSEVLVIFTVIRSATKYILIEKTIVHIFVTLILICIILICIHLAIGYILLITTGIQRFIAKVEDTDLKIHLLISYFILSTYFTVFLFDPTQFKEIYFIGLIGLAISYLLNFKILIKLINNPKHIKSKHTDKTDQNVYTRIVIVSILLLFMIILNLYLATCLINQAFTGSFSNNPNNFDLFYYTIITFTTIGYGDIIPLTIPAKIMSIIISFSSVVCITIFLSTVLSYKEDK